MEWFKPIRISVILASGLILALAGCAGKPVNKTLQAEEALAAAGFELKMADTPAKLERIRKIPQKQVVRVMIKDHEAYLWADAADCRCYYLGTPQDNDQLHIDQQEAKELQRIDWYEEQHQDPLWLHRGWDDF